MNHEPKRSEKVAWGSSQGKTEGTVEKKLVEPMDIKKHHVAASKENPEFLVKSDKTEAEAAHKASELKER